MTGPASPCGLAPSEVVSNARNYLRGLNLELESIMTCYLGNAFSAGMLDTLVEGSVSVTFTLLTVEQASAWVREHAPRSCVGHADTAALVSALLDTEVALNRVSTSLRPGDKLLIAQYNGPRLPEGATALPEGASLRWILAILAA